MIARYTRPEMGRIWSDENKFRTWLEVELAASEAGAFMRLSLLRLGLSWLELGLEPRRGDCYS